jgi:hypothetical protein
MALVFFTVGLKDDANARVKYLNEAYADSLCGSAVPDIDWYSK